MDLPLEGSICPISQNLMQNPVVAFDGYSYERVAIEAFFASCRQRQAPVASPVTGQQLASDVLIPNVALQQAITGWRNRQMQALAGGGANTQGGANAPQGASMYPSSSSGAMAGGFVVGIPQMTAQATTYYPTTQLTYNIVTGQVMAPAEKNQAGWRWSGEKKGSGVALAERGALATRESPDLPREKLIAVSERPIRMYSNETQEFHVKIVSTSTAWGGLQIGVVPEYADLADESMVDSCIDTRGYMIDGDRWMKTPEEGNQLCSFNSGDVKADDVVSVLLSEVGGFFVLKNGRLETRLPDLKIPCKLSDPPLYPFVILTGNCNACRLGVSRPDNFALPEECRLTNVHPSAVNVPLDISAGKA